MCIVIAWMPACYASFRFGRYHYAKQSGQPPISKGRGTYVPNQGESVRSFWLVCGCEPARRDKFTIVYWLAHDVANPTLPWFVRTTFNQLRRRHLRYPRSARNGSLPQIRVNCVVARLCSGVTKRNAASSQTGTQASGGRLEAERTGKSSNHRCSHTVVIKAATLYFS